jgi:hypothetical protein
MGEIPRPLAAALARQGLEARPAPSAFEALARLVRPRSSNTGKRVLIVVEPERDRASASRLCSAVAAHCPGAVVWAYSTGATGGASGGASGSASGGTLRATSPEDWIQPEVRPGFAGVAPGSVQRPKPIVPARAGPEHARPSAGSSVSPVLRLTGEGPLAPLDIEPPEESGEASGPRDLLSEEELAMLLGDSPPPPRSARDGKGGA